MDGRSRDGSARWLAVSAVAMLPSTVFVASNILQWELRLRIRLDPPAIGLAAASLLVGGILFGHLLAENLACVVAGIRC